jgi:hypothetical protein
MGKSSLPRLREAPYKSLTDLQAILGSKDTIPEFVKYGSRFRLPRLPRLLQGVTSKDASGLILGISTVPEHVTGYMSHRLV